MTLNKRIKKIIYEPKHKYWIVNDKFEIDQTGTIWWSWVYLGKRGDFPQYIFDVAKKLIEQQKTA